MPIPILMKCLCVRLTDQSQRELTEWELKEDIVDSSVSQSRPQVSQRRGGDDASWGKWCKSPSPRGNTELMWVTSAQTSKRQRKRGHLEDMTPQIWRGIYSQNISYASRKIKLINKKMVLNSFLYRRQAIKLTKRTPSCLASASLHLGWHVLKVTALGTAHRTDLVDDGKDGVDEHQVVLLERQVVGLLQSEQHRPYQGDLGGA